MIRILALLVVCMSPTWADAKTKYGMIDESLVSEKAHPKESDAHAAILYQEGETKMSYNTTTNRFELRIEVFKRIKIYDEDGTSYGTQTVDYYDGHLGKEKLTQLEGIVYNMKNEKLVKSKLSKDGIFKEQITKEMYQQKAALPNVKSGSVIDFRYVITSPYVNSIPKWYHQYDIPVNESVYKIETLDWFSYNKNTTGSISVTSNTEEHARTITITGTRNAGTSINVNKKTTVDRYDYIALINTYIATEVPSLKDEDDVPNMNNYRSSITFELRSSNVPGEGYRSYNTSWNGISAMLAEDDDLGKQLNKKYSSLDTPLNQSKDLPELEKAKFLFDYVQENIKWNGYDGKYAQYGIKKALKEKEGNGADINLTLCKLLKDAGFQTALIGIKTADRGFVNAHQPSQRDINYIIAWMIDSNEKGYFLDASDKDNPFGFLPSKAINFRGLPIVDGGSDIISMGNPNIGSIKKIIKASIDEDLNLLLSSNIKYKGYAAILKQQERKAYNTEEDWLDHQEEIHTNMLFDKSEVSNEYKKGHLTQEKQEAVTEEGIEEIGNKLYVNAFLNSFDGSHEYHTANRSLPVFKNQLIHQHVIVQLTIPEGYQLESAPENTQLSLPDDMGSFQYTVTASGNKIVVTIKSSESAEVIAPAHYEALKYYHDLIVTKGNEKIILAKQ